MRRLWIGVPIVLVLTGLGVVDRLSPAKAPLPALVRPSRAGGVWACPVVKLDGAGGFLHLANTGSGPSTVRITYVPDGRKPIERAITLAAGHAATVGTPGGLLRAAAGAIVQYAGGSVAVSRTAFFGGGAGAAPCSRPGPATLVVPQGSTLKADTQLVIMNPTAADATVDVALLVNGQQLRPQLLTGRVVPAGSRLVVREGDFSFDARATAAMITAEAGRVVVDGTFTAVGTVDIIPAVPATREVATVASTARGAALFSVVAIGENDAVTAARLLTAQGPTTFGPLVTGLPPDKPLVSAAAAEKPGAIALHVVSSTSPVAISARWQIATRNGSSEWAVSAGVQPSRDVVALLGPPAAPPAMRILITNPDPTEATIGVTILTESGPAEPQTLQGVRLAPGRSVGLSIAGVPATSTVGVVIHSKGARIVAALEATTAVPLYAAYAVTAIPIVATPRVAVVPDPREGVPAP